VKHKVIHTVTIKSEQQIRVFFILALIIPLFAGAQFYNGSNMSFGKNRVQFKDFFWTYFRFDRFDTYFYLEGKPLALFTAGYAEKQIKAIEDRLDFQLEDKIQFIIFNKKTDFRQTNLGLLTGEQYNTGGVTRIIGTKVFLYFDGTYQNFEKQIRAGIAEVIFNQIIYGTSFLSNLKNEALLSLPDWYQEGLLAYLSDGWNTDVDNRNRDAFFENRFKKFNKLSGEDAVLAGHSFWNYIADKYGETVIPNIIYLTRISKSVERGFMYVLGKPLKELIEDWHAYYDDKYRPLQKDGMYSTDNVVIKNPGRGVVYDRLRLSPDGENIAFVTNDMGQYKVWIKNLKTNKKKMIRKGGHKLNENVDLSYPLIAWHPSGKLLSVILEAKGKTILYFYTLDDKKFDKRFIYHFEKILDFSYSQNGKLFAVSAVKKGQTDIYVYNIAANSIEQLTNDIYDDLNPRFINNSKAIVFSSDRTSDTLKNEGFTPNKEMSHKYDVYVYNYARKSNVLQNLSQTADANEILPMQYENGYITYLGDGNGVYNRYMAKIDSTISFIDTATHYRYYSSSFPVTDKSFNILDQDINTKCRKAAEVVFYRNHYHLFVNGMVPAAEITKLKLTNTSFIDHLLMKNIPKKNDSLVSGFGLTTHKRLYNVRLSDIANEKDSNKIDVNNYTFGKQAFIQIGNSEGASDTLRSGNSTYIMPKQRNYDVEYSVNNMVSQVDFSYLNTSYQPFSGGYSPVYLNPGLNALFMVGITDLMEDYRITGGFRFSIDLNNTEYLISYANLKRRLDKEITYHRTVLKSFDDYSGVAMKQYSNELMYMLKWPFSEVFALKGTLTYKNDELVFGSTDIISLKSKNIMSHWGGIKAELVYDATRSTGLNLYNGLRYKIFGEYYQKVEKETKNLIVLGADFRYYQKIHRSFIWANRLAMSTSFGGNKLIYYLGGVDNWLFPKFNMDIPVDNKMNYAYQTLATNLRGFTQNIRNGNNFVVLNSELRMPLFRYLLNRPIKSEILNSFQIVAFGDVGSAWKGWNPYSDENTLIKKVIARNSLVVTVIRQIDPIVGGFGFGLRAKLLGYFVRADWAWGVESMSIQPMQFYLSLNLDF